MVLETAVLRLKRQNYNERNIKNMIKNLIFDVGGVLLDYRWKEMLMDYGLDEADAVRVGTQMFDDPDRTWSIFDLGTKTDEEIADTFCKKYTDDEEVKIGRAHV